MRGCRHFDAVVSGGKLLVFKFAGPIAQKNRHLQQEDREWPSCGTPRPRNERAAAMERRPRSGVRRLRLFHHPFARNLVEQIVTRHGVGEEAVERLQHGRLKCDQASAASGKAYIAMLRGLFQ
jgi:hypothetical protein